MDYKNIYTKKKKVCIYGAGGFGREVLSCLIDTFANSDIKINEVACFMVDDCYIKEKTIMGADIIPTSRFEPQKYDVVVAIGNPLLRRNAVNRLPKSTTYTTIIHPSAVISKWVDIGEGSIITAGCILTCNIQIGKHAHINLHSTIGHDCVIKDFLTTAPAVNISGNCHLGECVYLGTNSAVRQGINICDHVQIGMGGIVVKDITKEGTYIGIPVKKLEK